MERIYNQTGKFNSLCEKIRMVQRLLPIIKTCVITFVLTHGVEYAVGEHQGINLHEVCTCSKQVIPFRCLAYQLKNKTLFLLIT